MKWTDGPTQKRSTVSLAGLLTLVLAAILVFSQMEPAEAQGGQSVSTFRTFGAVATATPRSGQTQSDRPYQDVVIGIETDLDNDTVLDTRTSLAPDVDGDGMADIVVWRRLTRENGFTTWRGEWLITLSSSRYDAYVDGTTISNRSGFGNVWVAGYDYYQQPYLKIHEDLRCYLPVTDPETGNIVPLVGNVSFDLGSGIYDADGKADLGCVNRFQRTAYFLRSDKGYDKNQQYSITIPTGVPVYEGVTFYMADVDGDLKDDLIAVEPDTANNRTYFYLVRTRASNTYGTFVASNGSTPRDKHTINQLGAPFFADVDGDGKIDFGIAKFDTSGGTFKYRLSNAIGGPTPSTNPGKFNDNSPGSTADDGTPTAFQSETTSPQISAFAIGTGQTAYPVVADYDSDFVADLAVALVSGSGVTWKYRSSIDTNIVTNGNITHSTTNAKLPVPGYWDGDARADLMYVVNMNAGGVSGISWNWFAGFSAGSRFNDYLLRDNNAFPSEKWGGAMGNWQDVQPTGTIYPPVPAGTPTPNWGIRCYRPEAQLQVSGVVSADTDLDEIACTQGYQLTPTPASAPPFNVTPVVSGFEAHQIYKVDELAQTFEANYSNNNSQRYYLNRRSFANAWANYLDPNARMHLILYKVTHVVDSDGGTVSTSNPDERNQVDLTSPPDGNVEAGAWHYNHDHPGAIQIYVDVRGKPECGALDRKSYVVQSDSADLTSIVWKKAEFKNWLMEHRRGPLGNPRHWYVFNLMPEIEGCTKLGPNADHEADPLKAVRAFTRVLDQARDDIESYYELRVIPSLAMFGPQFPTRNANDAKDLRTGNARFPEGWWYGLLDETTTQESDELTNNTRLGFYIRLLRRLTAADDFNTDGDLLDDADWTTNDAALFREFYRYNQQDNYTQPPDQISVDQSGSVSWTPPPAATLDAAGADHARSMMYSARDLFAMRVVPTNTGLKYSDPAQGWQPNKRPSIIGQFGVGVTDLENCVEAASSTQRHLCRTEQSYANARMLQAVMRQFESLLDDTTTVDGTTYKYGDIVAGVSYWTPITIAGYTLDDIRSQEFNHFNQNLASGEALLEWNLTNNLGQDSFSVSFTPTGQVFLRGAAGFFAGPSSAATYPSSSTTVYNTHSKVGATTRFVDNWTYAGAASWSKTNDYSDWDKNLHAAISVTGSTITGSCTVDAGWSGDVVYMLRDLSDSSSSAVKASGTWQGGGGTTGSVTVTSAHTYQMTCAEKNDYPNRSAASYTAP